MAKTGKKAYSATRWMRENWRPLAAFIYLLINLFDFIIAPIFMGFTNETTAEFVKSIMGLDPSVQAILANKPNNGWQPLTLMGSGMFHISFGAILGVSAWSRGTDKVGELRQEAYNHAVSQMYPRPTDQMYDPYNGYGQNPTMPPGYPNYQQPCQPPGYPPMRGQPTVDVPEGD